MAHPNGRRPPNPYTQNKARYAKVKNRRGPSIFQFLATVGVVILLAVVGLMFLTS
jgi:hypothetical protein